MTIPNNAMATIKWLNAQFMWARHSIQFTTSILCSAKNIEISDDIELLSIVCVLPVADMSTVQVVAHQIPSVIDNALLERKAAEAKASIQDTEILDLHSHSKLQKKIVFQFNNFAPLYICRNSNDRKPFATGKVNCLKVE
jgi:hypothetical protein